MSQPFFSPTWPDSSSFRVFREDFRQQLCRWPAGVERECLLSKDGILSQHQRLKEGHSAGVTSVTQVAEHEDLEKMKQAGFALCTNSLLHCFA